MSIETNLNVTPYFDDFDKDKGYYKILFRPGVSVQARELTQIQTVLQNQVESFGDHVFKSGTIISGVNFQFYPNYNYVKILDNQIDGQPAAPAAYMNLYAKNSSNLESKIINYKAGYQSTDPDMNYLYVQYLNSGDSGVESSYSNTDVLTIFDKTYGLYDFAVVNGGTGFSNGDTVEIVSNLLVNSAAIGVGTITQTIGSNTANVYVLATNTSFNITIANVNYTSADGYAILTVKPNEVDLANSTYTSARWTVQPSYNIVQGANSSFVVAKIGYNGAAVLTTDSSGVISDVSLTAAGSGYYTAPYVTVRSSTGAFNNLEILPQMYKAQVTVADSTYTGGGANPVGTAYAFGVTEGTIYQKGYFVKVADQTIVVNAYSSAVNDVSVGFATTESIVNNNVDSTLLDNATGAYNFAAPGAHRLKLTPTLKVISQANVSTSNSFFTLVDFRDGQPYKQNKNTSYNILLKEFERRTDDTNGNFVVDPFEISTKDKATWSNTEVNVVVDPGTAYINGIRLETEKNTFVPVARATTKRSVENQFLALSFGSYINVKEYAGFFNTQTASTIDLYDAPRQYYSTNQTSIAPYGKKLGTARVRSVILDSGIPGTTTAVYRVYLFDIRMETGYSFKDVESVYYDGPSASDYGIADLVLELDISSNKNIAVLKDSSQSSLIYDIGVKGVSNVTSVSYTYRTSNSSANISSLGILTHTVGDTYPYGNNVTLTVSQKRNLVVTPLANATSTNTATGAVTNRQATVTGTSLSTYFRAGDNVYLENGSLATANLHAKVVTVANSTFMVIDREWPFTSTANTIIARHLPAYHPISMEDDRVIANTDSLGQTLTINLGAAANTFTLSALVPTTIIYDAKKTDTAIEKTVTRNALVKISLADNEGGVRGPWSLGIPDVFRLNKVYVASTSSVNTNSTNITSSFFVNSGQNNDYYGLASLNRQQNGRQLSPNEYLLVDVDCFTLASATAAGYYTIGSYKLTQNNTPRSSLSNNYINILEIPVYKSANGKVMSLENCIDFRPRAQATANVTSTLANATTNPSSNLDFGSFSKNFPYPDSTYEYNYSYYMSRKDRVVLDLEGNISVVKGTPSMTPSAPPDIADQMTLGIINIPPYPSIPQVLDVNQIDFLTTRLSTGYGVPSKQYDYQITDTAGTNQYKDLPKRYTMADIGRLERRVKNLEYYSSLNLLEKKTSDLVIPSSVNPSLNRFKNGFFVDKFENYLQLEPTNVESTAVIDQAGGFLEPRTKTLNLQARFNYANSTTLSSLHSEEAFTEPGNGKWGESVLTLPTNGTYDLVNQGRFTSAINGVGGDVQFIGDMVTQPTSLRVTFKGELKITDTYNYSVSADEDVSPGNTVMNVTDPFYNLTSDKTSIIEGQSANIIFETVNVANGTSFNYTITGVSNSDINVTSTGTLTVVGSADKAVASIAIAANSDASPEGTETLVFTVNTAGSNTASVSFNIRDDGLNPAGSLTSNLQSITEGGSVLFTLSTTNISNGTNIGYTLGGLGITAADVGVPLTGNMTINSTGGASLTVTTVADYIAEGSVNGVETLTLSVHDPLNLNRSVFIVDKPLADFTLASNTQIINEGSAVKFSLNTLSDVANTNIPYKIIGLNPGDITGNLQGTLALSNGAANVVITTVADMVTQGNVTFDLEVDLSAQLVSNLSTRVAVLDTTPKAITLVANTTNIDEGATVRYSLQANGWNGNTFTYVLSGVTAIDVDVPLTGTLTVSSNTANLDVTANTDGVSGEGSETMLLTLVDTATGSRTLSRAVIINDITPGISYSLSANKDVVNEGEAVVFTLVTTGVAPASYNWGISGTNITPADFVSSTSGSVTLSGNTTIASANVTITLATDVDYDTETFTFAVGGGFNKSKSVTINPTAIPPAYSGVDRTLLNLSLPIDQRTVTFTHVIPGYTGTALLHFYNSSDRGLRGPSNANASVIAQFIATGLNKSASDSANLRKEDTFEVLNFTNGIATSTAIFYADGANNKEQYTARVLLPTGYSSARGSVVNYMDTPMITFVQGTSAGTWKAAVPATVNAGNTFVIAIDTVKSYNGARFNYSISGVTSADLNGASLTGTIDTYGANTTNILGYFNGTGNSGVFTTNSSISSTKLVTVAIGSAVPGQLTPNTASYDMIITPAAITIPAYAARVELYSKTVQTPVIGVITTTTTTYNYVVDINTSNVPNATKLTYDVTVYRAGVLFKTLATGKAATIANNGFRSANTSYAGGTSTSSVKVGDVIQVDVKNGTQVVTTSSTVVPSGFNTTQAGVQIGY